MGGASELLWLSHRDATLPPPALHRADRPRRALRRLADPRHHPALHVRRLRAGRVEDARPPRARVERVLRLDAGRPRDRLHHRERDLHDRSPAAAASPSSRSAACSTRAPQAGLLGRVLARPRHHRRLGRPPPPVLAPAPRLRARRARRLQSSRSRRSSSRASSSSCSSAIYAAYVGVKAEDRRASPAHSRGCGAPLWELKWELGIPVILLVGLGTAWLGARRERGLVALYAVVIEFFVYKDLSTQEGPPAHREGVDEPRAARSS